MSSNPSKQCINISIIDDDELEEDEVFDLSILLDSRKCLGPVPSPYQIFNERATVTIIDDDCK